MSRPTKAPTLDEFVESLDKKRKEQNREFIQFGNAYILIKDIISIVMHPYSVSEYEHTKTVHKDRIVVFLKSRPSAPLIEEFDTKEDCLDAYKRIGELLLVM